MPRLIQFLFDNPILLFVLLAWVAGAIGNVLKAAKKARGSEGTARRVVPTSPPPRRAPAQPGPRSAEEIAAEMRRILGLEPEAPARGRAEIPPQRRTVATAVAPPPPPPPLPSRAVSGSRQRMNEGHVDPHVGEGMQHRHLSKNMHRGLRETHARLGGLGGRKQDEQQVSVAARRFPLGDLKRVIVLNEILGPPLALRSRDERGV